MDSKKKEAKDTIEKESLRFALWAVKQGDEQILRERGRKGGQVKCTLKCCHM